MPITSIIRSTGSYLPEKVMTNADLEKIVDTTDEWIFQRSGIKSRHIAADNESTGDMAIAAAKKALEAADLKPTDIDGVIVATTTPDRTFPSVAVKVQGELGMRKDWPLMCKLSARVLSTRSPRQITSSRVVKPNLSL